MKLQTMNYSRTILLVVFVLTMFLGFNTAVSADGVQLIQVTGRGVMSLPPDIVKISIGINTEKENIQEAINENTSRVESVKSALLSIGIAETDIKTVSYSLYSSLKYYRDNTAGPDEYIYTVYYSFEITLRDASKLNTVLDACVNNGANNVTGITYDSTGREAAYDEARNLAIDDATSKAQKIAEKLGVKIRNVDSIKVSDNSSGFDYSAMMGMGGGGDGAVSPSIEPGLVNVNVDVEMSFAYSL
ncbi:SIMPL domain-containing protein [Flexilinea flocculi]|uniref:Uncharacterized conserved protein YggE, contains kinase-interacting SIMPL domain n=1 Tax=Flexilinea flocculi TaxID=1678840 RepID=A0A0S7BUZ6_9CHLR|nr:SIMPL domain-containing protein [Flexilinea flocculi]NMB94077.1 SIMPL domain-containing protein [Flexilinea flocculi]GAP40601.1 uncharacterized conserved protein YggE, contains kinase-interacting SIMPL domain [Flexilinea flocculi]